MAEETEDQNIFFGKYLAEIKTKGNQLTVDEMVDILAHISGYIQENNIKDTSLLISSSIYEKILDASGKELTDDEVKELRAELEGSLFGLHGLQEKLKDFASLNQPRRQSSTLPSPESFAYAIATAKKETKEARDQTAQGFSKQLVDNFITQAGIIISDAEKEHMREAVQKKFIEEKHVEHFRNKEQEMHYVTEVLQSDTTTAPLVTVLSRNEVAAAQTSFFEAQNRQQATWEASPTLLHKALDPKEGRKVLDDIGRPESINNYIAAGALAVQNQPELTKNPERLHQVSYAFMQAGTTLNAQSPVGPDTVVSRSATQNNIAENLMYTLIEQKGLAKLTPDIIANIKSLPTEQKFQLLTEELQKDARALFQNTEQAQLFLGKEFVESGLLDLFKNSIQESSEQKRKGLESVVGGMGKFLGDTVGSITSTTPGVPANAAGALWVFYDLYNINGKAPGAIHEFARFLGLPTPHNKNEMRLFLALLGLHPDKSILSQLDPRLPGLDFVRQFAIKDGKKLSLSDLKINSYHPGFKALAAQAQMAAVALGDPARGLSLSGLKLYLGNVGGVFRPMIDVLGNRFAGTVIGKAALKIAGSAVGKKLLGFLAGGPVGVVGAMLLEKGMGLLSSGLNKLTNFLTLGMGSKSKNNDNKAWILIGSIVLIFLFVIMLLFNPQNLQSNLIVTKFAEGGIGEGGPGVDCAKTPDAPECKLVQCQGECAWPIEHGCIVEGPYLGSHSKSHLSAVDFVSPGNQQALFGAPVFTPRGGVVLSDEETIPKTAQWGYNDNSGAPGSQDGGTYGNQVRIRTDDGSILIFAHLRNIRVVQPGQRVEAKSQIGSVDHTGYSFDVHLHYERGGGDVNEYNPFPVPPCTWKKPDGTGGPTCKDELAKKGHSNCF